MATTRAPQRRWRRRGALRPGRNGDDDDDECCVYDVTTRERRRYVRRARKTAAWIACLVTLLACNMFEPPTRMPQVDNNNKHPWWWWWWWNKDKLKNFAASGLLGVTSFTHWKALRYTSLRICRTDSPSRRLSSASLVLLRRGNDNSRRGWKVKGRRKRRKKEHRLPVVSRFIVYASYVLYPFTSATRSVVSFESCKSVNNVTVAREERNDGYSHSMA